MNCILLFVLWTLVAAIPCQDRGLNIHFPIPKQFTWSTAVASLYDRILDESKKKEHRNSSGLLKEIYQIETATRHLTDLVDSAQFPLTEEHIMEVEQDLKELKLASEAFRVGLDPLERHVREVFRKIVDSRTEGLDSLGTSSYTGQ
nr:unknown [Medicago truncatula]